MCSKSQSLDSKLKPSTFSLKMFVFLLSSAALPDFCRTLFKMCSKSQSLDSKLKPSTFSAKMLMFLLSSAGLAETVVALATYSLTSVR